uniref:Uncharacterized protein n=1 Tax=Rhizophora mucronata TaxID=61149 RepID=A0A2P2PRE7_RHIMU
MSIILGDVSCSLGYFDCPSLSVHRTLFNEWFVSANTGR